MVVPTYRDSALGWDTKPIGTQMAEDNSVEQVLGRGGPGVRELAEALRKLVREVAPGATERGHVGWGNIAYQAKGVFCYIAPLKDSVNLGFHRGADLPDPQGLLLGTGKSMRHVKIRSMDEIDTDAVRALVRQAAELGGG